MKRLIILILAAVTHTVGVCFYAYFLENHSMTDTRAWTSLVLSSFLITIPVMEYWMRKYNDWLD